MGRKVKYLKPNEIAEELHPFVDFDSQKLIRRSDGWPRLHILVSCSECGMQRWLSSSDVRRQVNFTARCKHHVVPEGGYNGSQNPRWQGGRRRNVYGYIYRHADTFTDEERVILGPMFISGDKVLEHRAIMALSIGRPLSNIETVHHRNGVRHDNREENLELRRSAHGPGADVGTAPHCKTCSCHPS